jgi:DNA-binding beta-propeller fold protein YncE/cytochrome c peroxidase
VKPALVACWGVACFLGAAPLLALEIAAQQVVPVAVGEPHSFRIDGVQGAEGAVTYRWNFGDGTIIGPGAAGEAQHTYASAGHYTVIVVATDGNANRTSTSWIQTAHTPLTPQPPSNASSVVFDSGRNRLWNVNQDHGSVSVVDATSLTRIAEHAVGSTPRMLARAPDGSIWVTLQGSSELVVLNPDDGVELARVSLPYASQPHAIAFGPSGKAYVSLYATGELLEVDAATLRIERRVLLGPTPAAVSVAADGRIFVTRYISPESHGEVWVVLPDSFALVNTIVLELDQGPDSESAGRGVPNYVSSFTISPDGTQAWVTAKKDNVVRGPQRDGLPMNPDNFVRAIVCVIDMSTEAELLAKRIDIDNRALPAAVAFSPVGDLAYVLLQGSNWLGIFDAYSAADLSGIKDIGKAPDGLVFDAQGKLFVNSFLSRELIAYDLAASLASRDHQAPPPLARIPSVEHEPLSSQLLLGKQVFYDAADQRMSDIGYMSCAACHIGGQGDGRVWDFTDRGEGLRNTKPLLGAFAPGQGRLHWSANFDEVQDFERDIRESLGGTGFMSEADWLSREHDTFGTPAAGTSPELDALATYLSSLQTVAPSPLRNPDGSFTAAARRGRKIFEGAGCPMCHAAPTFSNSESGKLFDVGTLLPTSGHRLGGDLSGLDTPTLRGVWQSAPYLHDGRAATLRDVFAITGDQMGVTSDLSEQALDDLVRYLQELDDVPETEPPEQQPDSAAGASCSAAGPAQSATSAPWLALVLSGAIGLLRKRSFARWRQR